jgi:hypothetical protein
MTNRDIGYCRVIDVDEEGSAYDTAEARARSDEVGSDVTVVVGRDKGDPTSLVVAVVVTV